MEVGNETVLFRHEKTFFHPPAVVVRVLDTAAEGEIVATAKAVARYKVDYVGIGLVLNGLAVEAASGDPGKFAAAVATAKQAAALPLILVSENPAVMAAGLAKVGALAPLICAATAQNWEAMAKLAKEHKAPLVVRAATLAELAELTQKLVAAGVEDLVLDPTERSFGGSLTMLTQLRRLALKKGAARGRLSDHRFPVPGRLRPVS